MDENDWRGSALERPVRGEEETERSAVDESWDRYYTLPFREKIRERGIGGWLLHTNTGVVTFIVLQLAGVAVLFALFDALS